VISPWARENFVDHTLVDQSSVIRFIEANWLGGARIGGGSYDAIAGTLTHMFDFSRHRDDDDGVLILDPATGQPVHDPDRR
jgi:phospholipase C